MFVKFFNGNSYESDVDYGGNQTIEDIYNDIVFYTELKINDNKRNLKHNNFNKKLIDLMDTMGVKKIEMYNQYKRPKKYNSDVDRFIDSFHHHEFSVTATFQKMHCYWFAKILQTKFPNAKIKFTDKIANPEEGHFYDIFHFITEIDGREYDITGDVTGKYISIALDEMPEHQIRWLEENAINYIYEDERESIYDY